MKQIILIFLITSFFFSCQKEKPLFELLPSDKTGISFINTITEGDTMNILDTEYIYNGGGVAVGDLNGDGLQDLYFTGNQVGNKLYLNKGDLKFEDITAQSGADKNGKQWCSGVNILDINQDGKQDIYVCNTLYTDSLMLKNFLFVNQGNDKNWAFVW